MARIGTSATQRPAPRAAVRSQSTNQVHSRPGYSFPARLLSKRAGNSFVRVNFGSLYLCGYFLTQSLTTETRRAQRKPVLVQFESNWFSFGKTPKAFANCSPRLELRDNLGTRKQAN